MSSNSQYDQRTEQQLLNLVSNFEKTPSDHVHTQIVGDKQISILFQERGLGQGCYYAVIDGQPVAYCFGYNQKRSARKTRFIIKSTFVHPAYRQQGIGAALYTAIINSSVILVSDWELSPGAAALWNKLQQSLPYRTIISACDGYIGIMRNA